MIANEARQFVAKFISGAYDPVEYAAFLQWLEKDATIDELGDIADEHEALYEKWSMPVVGPTAEWVDQLEKRLDYMEVKKEQAPVRRLYPAGIVRKRLGIAAASIVLLTAGAYLWYNHSVSNQPQTDATGGKGNDLSAVYAVPRGGQQRQILLADGSKVWLNAASSVKYAEDGINHQRVVELSGEAFFDVAKKPEMPFRVKIKGAEIVVLGTQFNVKAYNEDAVSRTTLVDGGIKVIRGAEETTLQPGDQVEIPYASPEAHMKLSHSVDLETVLGWKNGDLEFNDDDLATVMQEIGRCYDLDVRLAEGVGAKRFTGNLSRRSDIHQIIEQLEHQNIHVKIDGRTIVVTR